MLNTAYGVTEDQAVNTALNAIETDLKQAVTDAIARLNHVLGQRPTETRVLHGHLADLHCMAAQIDANVSRRAQA